MKATAKNTKSAPKKADRGIPLDEIRRLMRVYGPTKCLRQRQGAADMKKDSVRRKFHRWFPDLEERFVQDDAGFYRPRFGHEFEMKYREGMRTRDGEALARKRADRRRQRRGGGKEGAKAAACSVPPKPPRIVSRAPSFDDQASTSCDPASPVTPVSPPSVLSAPSFLHQQPTWVQDATVVSPTSSLCNEEQIRVEFTEIKLEIDHDRTTSASIIADAEPLDDSFVAERGIFDDVEESFYGACDVPDRPTLPFVPEDCSSSSKGGSSPSVMDGVVLDKSMEEYWEEIGFRLDIAT